MLYEVTAEYETLNTVLQYNGLQEVTTSAAVFSGPDEREDYRWMLAFSMQCSYTDI